MSIRKKNKKLKSTAVVGGKLDVMKGGINESIWSDVIVF